MKRQILNRSYILFIVFINLFCIISCNNKSIDKQIIIQSEKFQNKNTFLQEEPSTWQEQSFEEFYDRFFNDTLFQMSRIVFPLRGLEFPFPWTDEMYIDSISDTVLDNCFIKNHEFFWTKKNWNYFHPLVDTVHFEEIFRKNTDTLKEVEIRGKEVDGELWEMHIFFDYKKINGKWFLIYYESTDL